VVLSASAHHTPGFADYDWGERVSVRLVPKGFFPQQDNGTVSVDSRRGGRFVSGHANCCRAVRELD